MASYKPIIGHTIGLVFAALYTVAGQAHFTDRFTPELASNVELMTQNSHSAFWILGLEYRSLIHLFGVVDIITAVLLWRSSTRSMGLVLAVFACAIGLYGQLYTGNDASQVLVLLAVAAVGVTLVE
ncbi:Hypothetical protein R9X50_00559800 [Acrodontium crateriforme]|uniref:Uncharacterized protein n=1 Tax=Acrodontium crateriforme TaxID=150365 RepID=A0AAQ3RBN0_9PEZI|nr:Hypothetical protein R9X50_00559800 [Acrodontium crateriforme]